MLIDLLEKKKLTESAYVFIFSRPEKMVFLPGQHVTLKVNGEEREYSIYSSPKDFETFEILVKIVKGGFMSNHLLCMPIGACIEMVGVSGFLSFTREYIKDKHFVFITTGTGIAPVHSIVKTYPGIDYRLLHGVKYLEELYHLWEYAPDRVLACLSKEKQEVDLDDDTKYIYVYSRVTVALQVLLASKRVNKDWMSAVYVLVGNSEMIDDVQKILRDHGIDSKNIKTEVYF